MTNERPKLVFLWTYDNWGGAQVYLLAVMKLAMSDFDITVALPRTSVPDIIYFLDELGINYEYLDASIDTGPTPSISDKVRRQWRRVHAEWTAFRYLSKYDLPKTIVHIEAAPWQSWILLTALSLKGSNLFLTMHNIMPRTSSWRELIWKARLKFVSRLPRFQIFASNHDTKNMLKGWVTDKFWETIKVTYTAVDPTQIEAATAAELDRGSLRERFGIRKDRFVVLCVGQFIDRKGRWQYLEAAKLIADKRDDIDLVWLTPQLPEGDDLERVNDFGLGQRLKIVLSADVGKDRHSVLTFFRIADAFALPSLVEGLPIALLEAMAMGLPSISTNINAIPEAIFDEKTGLLIEPADSPALTAAIERLADDNELRERVAKAGRELVLSEFDERKVAADIIESYNEVLASR